MEQQQLSGIDASFLYLETPETPMHVAGLTYFELPPGFEESQRDQPSGFRAENDVFDTWFTSSLTPQIATGWLGLAAVGGVAPPHRRHRYDCVGAPCPRRRSAAPPAIDPDVTGH